MAKVRFFGEHQTNELLKLLNERKQRPPDRDQRRAQTIQQPDGIWVKNDAGEEIPAFSCVVKTGVDLILPELCNWDIHKIDQCSTTFNPQILCTDFSNIATGKPWFLPTKRFYRVKYDASWTPVRGDGCGPKPGEYEVFEGYPGCRIEDVLDATNKIALVSLESPITQLYCKCTSAMTGGAVATGSKYDIMCGAADAETDSGYTTVPDVFIPGGDIAVDDFLWLTWANNSWYGGKIC